jgi:hypothetical protein
MTQALPLQPVLGIAGVVSVVSWPADREEAAQHAA